MDNTIRSLIVRNGYDVELSPNRVMMESKTLRDGIRAIVDNGAYGFPADMAKDVASSLREEGLATVVAGDKFNRCVLVAEDNRFVVIDGWGSFYLTTVESPI